MLTFKKWLEVVATSGGIEPQQEDPVGRLRAAAMSGDGRSKGAFQYYNVDELPPVNGKMKKKMKKKLSKK